MKIPSRLCVLAFLLFGCASPVAVGLDESDANRVVVALDRASVDATKEIDPAAEGKFRVLVARDDVARALATMQGEALPRSKPPGVLDAIGKSALVPSQAAEHAQIVLGIAGELERSLEGVDGVLAARVHLSVPTPDPFGESRAPRPTASVLLEHRGATPPLSVDAVQRLVAGAVTSMLATDVSVVTVPRAAPPQAPGDAATIAHVGPIAVLRGSMRTLQMSLVGLVALVALLATATLVLYSRLLRARADLAARPPADRP
jgi:type III secretion protein J